MTSVSKYWFHDANNTSPRAKMTARTLHFPDAKSFIESVGELFTFRFLPKKSVSGYYPLAVEYHDAANDSTVITSSKDIIFPIKYHTLQVAELNPDYPNDKPYCTLVPIDYNPTCVDYDFLIKHQKDEEGYLLDLYNQGLLPRMRDMVRGNEDPIKEGISSQVINSISDFKIKLPINMKNFNFNELAGKIQQDRSFFALRILGGWRMETHPDVDTLGADCLWSCRVGVTFGLYPWNLTNMKTSSDKKPPQDRKRKADGDAAAAATTDVNAST
jgi:hypothetical protein